MKTHFPGKGGGMGRRENKREKGREGRGGGGVSVYVCKRGGPLTNCNKLVLFPTKATENTYRYPKFCGSS